jgi:hypothetical protein
VLELSVIGTAHGYGTWVQMHVCSKHGCELAGTQRGDLNAHVYRKTYNTEASLKYFIVPRLSNLPIFSSNEDVNRGFIYI